jgi:hypothetical protein
MQFHKCQQMVLTFHYIAPIMTISKVKREMANKMEKRLPVTEETHKRMTEFRDGAGMTYDQVVNLLLDRVAERGEEFQAGAKLAYASKANKPQSSGQGSPD